jgi:hypothetical protein
MSLVLMFTDTQKIIKYYKKITTSFTSDKQIALMYLNKKKFVFFY